jgi:adenylate cyclase
VRFNDEIGRLTSKFNDMAQSLKTAEESVHDYTEFLESKVHERTAELQRKNEENERLLLNILPSSVAERLKRGEGIIADARSEVSIVFADIVGFTKLSADMPPSELVELLSGLISDFDMLAEKHGVQKIKTIGDAYLAVAGLPDARPDHAEAAVRLASDMLEAIGKRKTRDGRPLQLRIGINSGPVIAGVIGTRQFAYDLWGDTVNTASRMESSGEPGRIQVTEATFRLLKEKYRFESRGEIDIKGKGRMRTYFIARDSFPSGVPLPSRVSNGVRSTAVNDREARQSQTWHASAEALFTAA